MELKQPTHAQREFADTVGNVVTANAQQRRTLVGHVRNLRQRRFVLPFSAVLFVAGVLLLLSGGKDVGASVANRQIEEWLPVAQASVQKADKVIKAKLKFGDTAVSGLGRLGFASPEVTAMVDAARSVYSLKNIQAGHLIYRSDAEDLTHVYYNIDSNIRLHLYSAHTASEGVPEWRAELLPREVKSRRVLVRGTIEDSLFAAAAKIGLDERTAMNLVDIFAWDVDFAKDIHAGDEFSVLYEEQFDDNGKVASSTILAAEFRNQGELYQAVRFELPNGRTDYFTPEGKSLRKSYLKSPVKFSRISSRFSLSRKHPVLGYNRAHRGVDYAAAKGTPVRAVGDGRVVFSSWRGGYGRFVEIRHTNGDHTTAYAHLSGFGRGIRKGVRVKQGQIIGYVGMTGVATGPHLHFEFRLRGRAVNPLAVKRAPADPVPAARMPQFEVVAMSLLRELQQSATMLAWG